MTPEELDKRSKLRNLDWAHTSIHYADGSCGWLYSAIDGDMLHTVIDGKHEVTPLRELGINFPVKKE